MLYYNMNVKFIFQIIKIFYFIICFQFVENLDLKIYFTYPYTITLSNNNIFVVHQFGVDVIDPLFTKILKRVIIFSEDEIISTEKELSKLEVIYRFNYIIVLIKDKIYIFNNNADLLSISDDKISSDMSIEYYALVPYRILNGFYYFVVGFFDTKNYLNLLLYKYQIEGNKIIYITTKRNTKLDGNSFEGKSLACEFMKYIRNSITQNLLTCFLVYRKSEPFSTFSKHLSVKYYNITENEINEYSYSSIPSMQLDDIKFLKIAKNNSSNLAYICFYQQIKDSASCLKYDTSNRELYGLMGYNKKCRNKIYGLKVKYISETDIISFSCIDYDGSIQADFLDNQLQYINGETSIKQFLSCKNIYGHSILFLANLQKYFVLSDALCNNNKYLLQELENKELRDQSNITEIEEAYIEEEEIEEEEKIEEKEIAIICEEKCEKCDKYSSLIGKCIKCNQSKNYYPIKAPLLEFNATYVDCKNDETKPKNFYFIIYSF